MRKPTGLAIFVAALAAATVWAATRIPADVTFRDASFSDANGTVVYTDMIRSDGFGPYQDGVFCVNSAVSGNQFFLRTVKYGCTAVAARALTLDFSQPVDPPDSCSATDAYVGGTLNLCGTNVVADVRVVATSAFSSSALTGGTPLRLLFSMSSNFSGPGSFDLIFEQNVTVAAGTTSRTRVITAPATAVAELYQNVPVNKKSSMKVSLGRYYTPTSFAVDTLQ